MDHAQLRELLPLAALDRLDADGARELEAHLRGGCDECEAELREYREALAAMALGEAGEGPADRIWSKLDARLRSASANEPAPLGEAAVRRGGVSRGWRVATIAAAAAAIIAAILAGNYANQLTTIKHHDAAQLAALDAQTMRLSAALTQRNRELTELRGQLARAGELTRVILSPDVRTIKLGPLAPAPDAVGIVAVSASRDESLLHVAGLPPAPPEKAYELWWIGANSGPVRAALFTPGREGAATVAAAMPPAGEKILASAITLEPAGGVNKPTGAMYLKGAP